MPGEFGNSFLCFYFRVLFFGWHGRLPAGGHSCVWCCSSASFFLDQELVATEDYVWESQEAEIL